MFEKFKIWKYKQYHELQGKYPVIFVTLLSAKGRNFRTALMGLEDGLEQIEEKNYEAEILAQGIPKERIYKLGFGFDKKEALAISKDYNGL